MARGKTLTSLLNDLRVECKLSLNPAHNNQVESSQINSLQKAQEFIWDDFDWPHLRVERMVSLQAGQRYYDLPEDLSVDRIEKIEVRDNGRWRKLDSIIDARHYEAYDSDLGVRAWPVRRWQIREDGDFDPQMEMWPIPDTNADPDTLEGTLKITGIRNLRPLVSPSDVCDLDNQLIVLYAAVEQTKDSETSGKKLSRANKRLIRMRGDLTPRKKTAMFAASRDVYRCDPCRPYPRPYPSDN